uniref:Uncharacterized protein n=1 Tax=Opuntia streptacantha TaxID=393608 RepID=A0A7C9CZ88_OPUST
MRAASRNQHCFSKLLNECPWLNSIFILQLPFMLLSQVECLIMYRMNDLLQWTTVNVPEFLIVSFEILFQLRYIFSPEDVPKSSTVLIIQTIKGPRCTSFFALTKLLMINFASMDIAKVIIRLAMHYSYFTLYHLPIRAPNGLTPYHLTFSLDILPNNRL